MGGDPEFSEVWIPLHACPIDVDPLRILEGFHRFGVQDVRGRTYISSGDSRRGSGRRWMGRGHVHAGDILIFHSLTVHAASPNCSDLLRVSLNCRFQMHDEF
jgi:ectoine hydroxylase-related dioxygenase (phytanoyl-CoA dioxygenase family)